MSVVLGKTRCAFLVACAGLASIASAQQVVIGNFEDSTVDGWGTAGGPGNPVLSSVSTGATLGTGALKSVNPQGSFWGPTTGNLIPTFRDALIGATTLQFDLTMIGSEINGGSGSFDGFAQSKEIAVTMFAPDGPDPDTNPDVNIFAQRGNFGALTEVHSLAPHNVGEWNGVDGTRTLIWNLQVVTATDPADGLTKPIGQILANHPEVVDAKIAIVEQFGGGTATVGDGAFFFDRVILNVPEPTTLALAVLAAPAILRRRRV